MHDWWCTLNRACDIRQLRNPISPKVEELEGTIPTLRAEGGSVFRAAGPDRYTLLFFRPSATQSAKIRLSPVYDERGKRDAQMQDHPHREPHKPKQNPEGRRVFRAPDLSKVGASWGRQQPTREQRREN